MSLKHYTDAFSSLIMDATDGSTNPHKVCMLKAVMDLVAKDVITDNRIYYNEELKKSFTKHFKQLRGKRSLNRPHVPYFYLQSRPNSSRFWHHQKRKGETAEANYRDFTKKGNAVSRLEKSIEYAYVDPELFEYFKSADTRLVLKNALADNFMGEERNKLIDPVSGWLWENYEMAVENYFSMLELELKGKPYNKRDYYNELRKHLGGSNNASIESMYQNISTILTEAGMPIIDHINPSPDYQPQMLPTVIGAHIARLKKLEGIITSIADGHGDKIPSVKEIYTSIRTANENQIGNEYRVKPPKARSPQRQGSTSRKAGQYQLGKVDYLEREKRNAKLGLLGEKFIFNYEIARLRCGKKPSLADEVSHVSQEEGGDKLGYDIHSYEESGRDRFIEVKTTNFARHTRFYVTKNEAEVSKELENKYHLYRVFNFKNAPQFFQAQGRLEKNFNLDASVFIANIRSK
ncbi:MAG: DUF3883 domain-containing protein [Pseudohongiellaceae bacterium]